MIAGREELGLGEKATYCVSQFLFDRERVPGVSVILAILVVWGWVDAVEIVAGRSDFDLKFKLLHKQQTTYYRKPIECALEASSGGESRT
jgi:hypothetical protein